MLTKYIARQFGKPTGFGGILSTFIMNRLNSRQYNAVLDNIDVQTSDIILDIGFGNGYLLKKLLKKNPKKMYGIEISQDMLTKVNRRNTSALSVEKLNLQLADIKDLPHEDSLFDKIYTVNTLYFWKNPDNSFSEIKRTLKPAGIFLNVIYTKEWLNKFPYTQYSFSKYSIEQITTMTEKSGLKVIQIIEIQPKVSFCIIGQKQLK